MTCQMKTEHPQKSVTSSGTSTGDLQPACGQTSVVEALLQLLTLNAFAVLQPVLELISNNPRYLKLEGIEGTPVVLTAAAAGLLIPTLAALLIGTLHHFGRHRTAFAVQSVVGGLLSGLIGLYALRWISRHLDLLSFGVPDLVLCGCALVITMIAISGLRRSESMKQILRIASLGLIAFPFSFLMKSSMQDVVLGIRTKPSETAIQCGNPIPVVMVVFDGMSGMSLLDEQHHVDPHRYPSFARMAQLGTWYRNASTVHTRTDHAVPALLSSCYPEERQQPIESDYPTNLLRLIHDSDQYAMTVFEPVTELAPEDLRQIDQKLSSTEQFLRLSDAVTRVFARQVLPGEFESIEVTVPPTWFGFPGEQQGLLARTRGKISYSWDTDRATQFEHFISTVDSTDDRSGRPGFYFFHIALPHYPWTLFPDGTPYSRVCSLAEPVYGLKFESWTDDDWAVRLAWQRNLLQIQMADQFFGKLLKQLEEQSLLDECLLIVTADHGMSFLPRNDMRTPVAETMGDIVSVPLFVKLPHQKKSAVSDRNVEIVDIAPTVAEVLDFPMPAEWEGQSLLGLENRSERPRKTVRGSVDTILPPDFPDRFSHVQRLHAVFGPSGDHDRLGKLSLIPELTGRNVVDFSPGPESSLVCELRSHPFPRSGDPERFVPALIDGRFLNEQDNSEPVLLAIAVRNVIVATTRTGTDPFWSNRWSALLPQDQTAKTADEFRLFQIRRNNSDIELHEIPWTVEWDGRS